MKAFFTLHKADRGQRASTYGNKGQHSSDHMATSNQAYGLLMI